MAVNALNVMLDNESMSLMQIIIKKKIIKNKILISSYFGDNLDKVHINSKEKIDDICDYQLNYKSTVDIS